MVFLQPDARRARQSFSGAGFAKLWILSIECKVAVRKTMEHRKLPEQNKRSFSGAWKTGILWLAVLIAAAVVGFWLDPIVLAVVAEHSNKAVKNFAGFLSKVGDWPELMVLGAAVLFVVRRHRRVVTAVLCMMIAATLAGAAVNTVRLLSGRARPNNTEVAPGWYGVSHDGKWLLDKYKYHSFPSGHTGSALAFFGVLGFAFRRWNWGFVLFGVAIGWSRIYLNVHYLSDVLVGGVVGLFFAQLTWERFWPWLEEKTKKLSEDRAKQIQRWQDL
jgi:undecaprenyl-diphosphatase